MGFKKVKTDAEFSSVIIQDGEYISATVTNRPHLSLKDEINFLDSIIKTQEGTEFLDPLTTWNSGVSYSKGSCITFNSKNYASLQDSNLNHQPQGVTDSWWKITQTLSERFLKNYGVGGSSIVLKPNGVDTALSITTSSTTVTGDLIITGTITSNGLNADGSFLPSLTSEYDLGSTSLKWKNLYLSNNLFVNDISMAGANISSSAGTVNILNTPTTINFGLASTNLTLGATTGTTSVRNKLNVGTIGFNSGSNTLTWNTDDGTLDLLMNGGNVTHQIGLETFYRVKNTSGASLSNGKVARATGALGNSGVITASYGIANNTYHPRYFIGIVTEDIANDSMGYVTNFGHVRGINTTGSDYGETWLEGDILYASSTIAGGLTKVAPVAPNLRISMAMVLTVHATNGVIFVRVDNGQKIEDIQDIKLTSKSTGDILLYNSSTSLWENTLKDIATGNVLLSGGVGVNPSYGKVGLTTHVSGTLAVANGGTGVTSSTGSGANVLGTSPSITTSLTTGSTSFDLLNTTATTINFGGASTAINIGSSTNITTFNGTNSIKIPSGTTAQRAGSPVLGMVRYNSELSTFEGYGAGNAWGSLGGVKDVDGDTYILPELTPGADNDTLYFYVGGAQKGTLSGTGLSLANDLTVSGNLIVNGTTFTTNSTTVTIDDPVFTLGGDNVPTIDDNKDRGIEFRWHNGTVAKTGFFGFDDSTGKFTFIADATNTSEVFSGTAGDAVFGAITGTSFNSITSLASVASPMNGTAAVGTSTTVARQDHVHASDTTKANLASPTFTGTVTLPSTTSIGTISSTVLGYLDGVTSSIQTQINGKSPSAGSSSLVTTGTVTSGTWSASFGAVSGANLTNLTADNLSGTIPSLVLGNSTHYIGTTAVSLNRASASLSLTGVNIDGSAGSATLATKSTNIVGGNNTTLLGAIPYQSNIDTTTLLSPNTSSTKKYLSMTGTGTNGGVPVWDTVAADPVSTTSSTSSEFKIPFINHTGNTTGSYGLLQDSEVTFTYNPSINRLSVYDLLVTGSITESSDRRLKENIVSIDDALEKINLLNGVYFNKIETPNKKEIGFIAQDVLEVVPELVDINNENDMMSVSYARTVALLVQGMKEQQKEIQELKNLVQDLTTLVSLNQG